MATAIIDEHQAKLRALSDFQKLGETAVAQCMEKSFEARATMSSARFVTAIRDRLNRYRTQDYPAQLALVSRLATSPPLCPKPGGDTPPAAGATGSHLRSRVVASGKMRPALYRVRRRPRPLARRAPRRGFGGTRER